MTNQEYDAIKALLTSIDSAAEISGVPLGVLKNAEKVKKLLEHRIKLQEALKLL